MDHSEAHDDSFNTIPATRPQNELENQSIVPIQSRGTRLSPNSVRNAFWNGVLFVIAGMFLILGFTSRYLDGKPVESTSWGLYIVEASQLGATVYPYVFAVIMGGTIRTVAVWIAERGGKIFLLEQLLGSDTAFGSIITLAMLQTFNYTTLILIFLWCLSPLGSQSTLRVLSIGPKSVTGTIFYLDTSALSGQSILSLPDFGVFLSSFSGIYSASLISPTSIQQGFMDGWGKVKIPLLELLNGTTGEEWLQVPEMPTTPYSSLLGNPIAGIPAIGNATFEIGSSYFYLDCTKPVLVNFDQEFRWPEDSDACTNLNGSWLLGGSRVVNNTARGTCSLGSLDDNSGQLLNQIAQAPNPTLRRIMFQSISQNGIVVTNCNVSFPTVESIISCSDGNCKVTAMRPCSLLTLHKNEVKIYV